MRIKTKIVFVIFIGFIISISYQFEDFGVFKTFASDTKNNKTDYNNSTDTIVYSNSCNSTDNNNSNSYTKEESNEIIDKEITADKQKNFLKKSKNVDSNSENKDLAIADTNKHENSISNEKSDASTISTKNLRKEIPIKSEDKSEDIKENIGANLSEEEKKKLYEDLDSILSKLTDFDIKVSQLRAEFMNYTKKFLNHHYTMDSPDKNLDIVKEKDGYLVSYSEKMNDLNQLLQKYKLEIYVLKKKDQCPKKIINMLNEVETNFLNLITIIKDEIKESKIPLSFIMINFQEKNDVDLKLKETKDSLKDITSISISNNQKEEMADKGNVIL